MHPGDQDGAIEVRYTARDSTLYAFVLGGPEGVGSPAATAGTQTVTLASVRPTVTTTAATLTGSALPIESTPQGLQVTLAAPLSSEIPTVVVLHQVDAAQAGGR